MCRKCKGKGGRKCSKCGGSGMIPDGSVCPFCDDYPKEPGKDYKLYKIRWWAMQGDYGTSMYDRHSALERLRNYRPGEPMTIGSIQLAKTNLCETCSKEILQATCPSCRKETKPRIRHYEGVTCTKCQGRSKRVKDCSDCHGSGVFVCEPCESNGSLPCTKCQGSGRITVIVSKEV
jgi:hypothetical protein